MKRLLATAALVCILGSAQLAAAEDPLAVLDACIAQLDPDTDVGFDRIAARCPDLARHLLDSGWSEWLPRGWQETRNDLSAGSLRELRVVVTRELSTQATVTAPDVERLETILAELGQTGRESGGLWARFKNWLRSVFEQRPQPDGQSWFDRMVARIGLSQTVVEITTYAALLLIVLLAAFIVVNELRAAGLLGARRRERIARGEAYEATRPAAATWRDVELAPLPDKPRLLLDLVADRLTALQRLPPARSLTVNELTRAAQLTEPEDRNRLVALAGTAEQVRFSDAELAPSRLEAAVLAGRELLASLEARSP